MEKQYIFITGASSGMGEATAKLLCKEKNLLLHGRNIERLEHVGEECKKYGNDVVLFPYDLEQANTLANDLGIFLKDRNLPIEAFLHFAGMTEVLPISKTKYSIGLKVMNINYFSATEIISTLLKKKINEKNLKNIILISSIVTYTGKKYQPHYCASKGAIESLILALACELAPNVRVNGISPGSFKTRIIETLFADTSADAPWQPDTLLPSGDVTDIANIAQFLLSDASRYLTGEILKVDGGEHFKPQ